MTVGSGDGVWRGFHAAPAFHPLRGVPASLFKDRAFSAFFGMLLVWGGLCRHGAV
jgi:hypothetical protein